jgi:hypothetical protein
MDRPNKPNPTMTDNERARIQGFKNFLEKKQKEASKRDQDKGLK